MDEFKGHRFWVIPEESLTGSAQLSSQSGIQRFTAWLHNYNPVAADVRIAVFFSDKEREGTFRMRIPAHESRALRLSELEMVDARSAGSTFILTVESTMPVDLEKAPHPLNGASNNQVATAGA